MKFLIHILFVLEVVAQHVNCNVSFKKCAFCNFLGNTSSKIVNQNVCNVKISEIKLNDPYNSFIELTYYLNFRKHTQKI